LNNLIKRRSIWDKLTFVLMILNLLAFVLVEIPLQTSLKKEVPAKKYSNELE
jgi:hypothetical protein